MTHQEDLKKYQTILPLDIFLTSLVSTCSNYVNGMDPKYFENFYAFCVEKTGGNTLPPLNEIPDFEIKLNPRFKPLAMLLGSAYEVKYGWNQFVLNYSMTFTEVTQIVPTINERDWWKFCSDSMWFADYALLEKTLAFLKRYHRFLKPRLNDKQSTFFNESIDTILSLKRANKLVRDPLAHGDSTALGEKSSEIFWQLHLIVGYKMNFQYDPLDMFVDTVWMNREKNRQEFHIWLKRIYTIITRLFSGLNKLKLERLALS